MDLPAGLACEIDVGFVVEVTPLLFFPLDDDLKRGLIFCAAQFCFYEHQLGAYEHTRHSRYRKTFDYESFRFGGCDLAL